MAAVDTIVHIVESFPGGSNLVGDVENAVLEIEQDAKDALTPYFLLAYGLAGLALILAITASRRGPAPRAVAGASIRRRKRSR